jgi:Holliday junction resolvase RusA-like endonuclease
MISFSVPGRPIPTARPRVLRSGRTFIPKRSKDAQQRVAKAALEATGGKRPLFPTQALSVGIVCCFPYSKGTPKKRIEDWAPRTVRPDVDNLSKTILDGCNGILWADDAQIVEMTVSKWMVAEAHDVGTHVEIGVKYRSRPRE